jgi:hypothetical protein
MPFLLDLGRLCRLGRLHQRLHGVDPFIEIRKAPHESSAIGALFAGERQKVKQIRAFADG